MDDQAPGLPPLIVRDARPDDRAVIAEFNARLAAETEGKTLDPAVLDAGVRKALADPDRLRYRVAERGGLVVGQIAITREWSDWRNGWIWWLQSVYVHPDERGRGTFRSLYEHLQDAARAEPDVLGLRLYVEAHNDRAMRTYRALGLEPGGYEVFEALWPDRLNRRSG